MEMDSADPGHRALGSGMHEHRTLSAVACHHVSGDQHSTLCLIKSKDEKNTRSSQKEQVSNRISMVHCVKVKPCQ